MNYTVYASKYDNNTKRTSVIFDYSSNEDIFTTKGRNIIEKELAIIIKKENDKITDNLFLNGIISKESKENTPQPSTFSKGSFIDDLVTNFKNNNPKISGNDKFSTLRALQHILFNTYEYAHIKDSNYTKFIIPNVVYHMHDKQQKNTENTINFIQSKEFTTSKDVDYDNNLDLFKQNQFPMEYFVAVPAIKPPSLYEYHNKYEIKHPPLMEISKGWYEESIALAAYDLLNYYLHRPIWEFTDKSYSSKLSSIPHHKDNEYESNKQIKEYTQSILDGTYQSWYVERGELQFKYLVKTYNELKLNYADVFLQNNIIPFDLPVKDCSNPRFGMDARHFSPVEQNSTTINLAEKLLKKLQKEEVASNRKFKP